MENISYKAKISTSFEKIEHFKIYVYSATIFLISLGNRSVSDDVNNIYQFSLGHGADRMHTLDFVE